MQKNNDNNVQFVKTNTFFPSPNPNFGASWEKWGFFLFLKIESLFPSLSIYFFPHFAHPQIQISVCLGEKWGWTPQLFLSTPTLTVKLKVKPLLFTPILSAVFTFSFKPKIYSSQVPRIILIVIEAGLY